MTKTNKIFFIGSFLGLFLMYAGVFSTITARDNDMSYAMFVTGLLTTGSVGLMRMTTDLYSEN